ncbi:LOW QUALITY PROTEIN: hypothetical protein BC938DRAFT_477153 [Jimgerdemannia flammicorona]|uniref:FAD dependent oxidoreductase domain-containing protein n=1 Tax=Jimgerdemannia flammicorona TaxID=994334 RepID=A0A433QYW2_9FUNG|nr:LOW QUALITY PROTEIN: hypothetical protein BC938DRAFT_477153 [Jimgerdemannia flammicorona]
MGKQAIVIGAGVVGLTTALILQQRGFQVTIVARHFPGEFNKDYTSPWAGAHWRSYADKNDVRQRELDVVTYRKLWNDGQSNSAETGVWIIDAFDYWDKVPEVFEEPCADTGLCTLTRHFVARESFPSCTQSSKHEIFVTKVSINSSKYLAYLLRSFTALGGTVDRRLVQHIGDVMLPGVDIVANCTGLSARTLGGVEDSSVFPARGQIVIIKAPHVDFTFERYSGGNGLGSGGTISYVIPRDNGEVILGGTYRRHGQRDHGIRHHPALHCDAPRPSQEPPRCRGSPPLRRLQAMQGRGCPVGDGVERISIQLGVRRGRRAVDREGAAAERQQVVNIISFKSGDIEI